MRSSLLEIFLIHPLLSFLLKFRMQHNKVIIVLCTKFQNGLTAKGDDGTNEISNE